MAAGNNLVGSAEFSRRKKEREDAKIFDVDSLVSIYSANIPPVQYLLDGLIVESAVGMIAGKFGSGKSTLILSMADAITRGADWCGLATKHSHALYLDRENPVEVTRARLHRMNIRDDERLKIWTPWHKEASIFDTNLDSESITHHVEKHPRCLVVVDSLVGFLPQGASENDAMHVREFLNLARKLSTMGATVVFLHHSGKGESSKQYRGSSDIAGSIDFGFTANATQGISGELLSIRLDRLKQRTLMLGDAEFAYDGTKFTRSSGAADIEVAAPFNSELVALLRANPGCSRNMFEKLSSGKGMPRSDARRFVDDGLADGSIVAREGPGRGFRLYWHDQQPATTGEIFEDDAA